jgi:hypothetical protein
MITQSIHENVHMNDHTICCRDIHINLDENILDNIITTYDVILLLDVRYPTLRVRRQLKSKQPPA